jgi:hypothetical protein
LDINHQEKYQMKGKARYRIKVADRLDDGWANWFEGVCIAHGITQDGATLTLLESDLIDQAALHGMLMRLRNLNLTLVCLELIDEVSEPIGRS